MPSTSTTLMYLGVSVECPKEVDVSLSSPIRPYFRYSPDNIQRRHFCYGSRVVVEIRFHTLLNRKYYARRIDS